MAVNLEQLKEGRTYRYVDGVLEEVVAQDVERDPRFPRSVRITQGMYEALKNVHSNAKEYFRGYKPSLSLIACALIYAAFKHNRTDLVQLVRQYEVDLMKQDLEEAQRELEAEQKK